MNYNHDFNPNCPNSPIQDYPLQPNCGPCHPMGWEDKERNGRGCEAPPAEECKATVVPPPIPPVRYVPGMNVQEQLTNMADRVNVSINRWNQIQGQCYKALDQVVGAAVNNDVYYAPDEVRYMEGYDEGAACSYSLVEARAVDRSGKPIFCHLRAAYNNETNTGAGENITDVSFVTSGQMVITATQATEPRWKGTTIFNCNPGASTPEDTVWVCGWTRNGVLRFFSGDVSQDTLRQNRMVSCIGPVFPIIKDHKEFTEVLGSMGEEPGSIQAIGWKPNGNKVFFDCGCYNEPGMTPTQVMKVMQGLGCATAVITSYQIKPVTAWDATPIAGTESAMSYVKDNSEVISVPGMTGGMTFLGKLSSAPIQWSIPQNCANWVITKRPMRGWRNAFTTEIANVVQRLGNQENSMNSILGQLTTENNAILRLQYQVQENASNIDKLQETVGGFDERISSVESRITKAENDIKANATEAERINSALQQEINTRQQQVENLTSSINQEIAERKSADAAIKTSISAEEAARKSADTVLQNNIDEEASKRQAADLKLAGDIDTEATTRANADRNLQNAIEAEASARSTKDTEHESRMDAIVAQEQKDIAAINKEIADIKDGSTLPIASKTQLGIVQIGENLTIDENGVLNAQAGGGQGGDTVEAGTGIKIAEEYGKKVISVDDNIFVNEDELSTAINGVNASINTLTTSVNNLKDTSVKHETDIGALGSDISEIESNVSENTQKITAATEEIEKLSDGSGLPIASADKLGAIKIGANLSISEDGTLSASGGEGGSGETVAQGNGITVEHNTETNVATVSLSSEVQEAVASIGSKANKADVDDVRTALAGKADKTTVTELSESVSTNTETIQAVKETADSAETKATAAANGVSVLNSNVTAIDNRLKNAEANIDTITGQQETQDNEIETLKAQQEEIDGNVESAINMAADAEKAAAEKVDKSGDEMTGSLKMIGGKLVLATPTGDIVALVSVTDDGLLKVENMNRGPVILNGIKNPENAYDAANKAYVDSEISGVSEAANNANVAAADAVSKATDAESVAQQAQSTANEVKETVENAGLENGPFLPLSGGTITGLTYAEQGITVGSTYKINGNCTSSNVITLTPVNNDGKVFIRNVADSTSTYDAVNVNTLNTRLSGYMPKSGGVFTGAVNMGGYKVTGIASPTATTDAVNLNYLTEELNKKLNYTNPIPSGVLNANNCYIIGVKDPVGESYAVNKKYVDDRAFSLYTETTTTTFSSMTFKIQLWFTLNSGEYTLFRATMNTANSSTIPALSYVQGNASLSIVANLSSISTIVSGFAITIEGRNTNVLNIDITNLRNAANKLITNYDYALG